MITPTIPERGSCKRALYDYLKSGKPYSHAMSQRFGISGTASPKRLQEIQEVHGLKLVYEDKKSGRRGKPFREYRHVPASTDLFTVIAA